MTRNGGPQFGACLILSDIGGSESDECGHFAITKLIKFFLNRSLENVKYRASDIMKQLRLAS